MGVYGLIDLVAAICAAGLVYACDGPTWVVAATFAVIFMLGRIDSAVRELKAQMKQ